MERREFMGFAVVAAPLAATLGAVGARTLQQFEVLPLPAPPAQGIEWLNELDPASDVRSRLGRYYGPLTEDLLLEAVLTCGLEKPRGITLSTAGCRDFVTAMRRERRYMAPAGTSGGYGYAEDAIMLLAPGKSLKIEVHFGLPNWFLTIG